MKRFAIGVVVLSILGLVAGSPALAKGGKNKGKRADALAAAVETFKSLDKNADAKLSLDEYKAGKPDAQEAEKAFKALDKNSDGTLSQDEFSPPVTKAHKNKNKKKSQST
jgi:Ca2+-binding EF-hand superfamily protein